MDKKRVLGQFFTKEALWLKPQVLDFIQGTQAKIAYDPFAGAGDLLRAAQKISGIRQITGLDIDENLPWRRNDSLLEIPHVENAVIITNPPYMSNYSAARKGLAAAVSKYFANTDYSDIYMIALDKMLTAQQNVVAIIPETFINSNYRQKNRLKSLTILEENPFSDTENPVLVACFDGTPKSLDDIAVYKNVRLIGSLGDIEAARLKPRQDLEVTFNRPNGWLAVRCVDTTDPSKMIKFDFKENIPYDWEKRIKVSSRLLTLIDVEVNPSERARFVAKCNEILAAVRRETDDLVLSPFKGNMKNGRRRRRLDYTTCRAIIERACDELNGPEQDPLYGWAQDLKTTEGSASYANEQILL